MEHRDYMEQALALAWEAAEHGEVPVGCVIVCAGRVIGRGRNRRGRSCPHRWWVPITPPLRRTPSPS